MIPASIYEEAGRARKLLRLVMALDGALSMMGCDPFSPAALEFVFAADEKAWSEAAKHANVPIPSAATIAEVENCYRRRIEIRAALNRIPLRAVPR